MKEFLKKVKILYDNKKYRSLVKLGAYLIFFTVVILIMQYNARHEINNEIITKITLDNMQSYAYKYTFTTTATDKNFTIEGVRSKDSERFVYNGKVYYITTNKLYEVSNDKLHSIDDNLVPIKLLKLNSKNLNKIINNANKDYTVNDKVVTEKYTISVNHFLPLYSDTDLDIVDTKSVFITLSKESNIVKSIELDLTDYFGTDNTSYKLLIEYSSINKISSFDIPYKIAENIEE